MKFFDPKRSTGAFNLQPPRLPSASPLRKSSELGFGLRALSVLTAFLVFLQGPLVMAASTTTWNGATSGSWGTAANWTSGVPTDAISAFFTPVVGTSISVDLGSSPFDVKGLSIEASSAGGASSITLGTLLSGGSLRLGTDGIIFLQPDAAKSRTLNLPSGVDLSGAQTWNAAGSGDSIAAGGQITGTASSSLTKVGSGSLTLSGTNTFAGGLSLTAGQINLNSGSAAGTGVLTISGGSLDNTSGSAKTLSSSALVWNGDFVFVGSNALNTGSGAITLNTGSVTVLGSIFTLGGSLGGVGGLTKIGAGTMRLNAAANYAGSTVVKGGSLSTTATASLPSGTAVEIQSGGTLSLGGDQTLASITGAGKLVTAGLTISNGQDLLFSGVLSGNGGLTLSAGTLTLGGTNTFGGITVVSPGATLKISNAAALGLTSQDTNVSDGGVLDLNGQAGVLESISLEGGGVGGAGALLNSNTATTGALLGNVKLIDHTTIGGSGDLSLAGLLTDDSGNYSLTKTGAGVLTLGGSSSYTGVTTVAQGTLRLAGANALGSDSSTRTSQVNVSAGASLDLNGIESAVSVDLVLSGTGSSNSGALVNSSTAVNYGGAISLAGSSAVTGGITLTGDISGSHTLSKVGAGTLVLAGLTNGASAILLTGGTLQIGVGGTSGTLGSGSVALSHGTALVFNRSDTYSGAVGNMITGDGAVTVTSGTLSLSGQNNYTGVTSLLTGSTLVLGSPDALGSTQRVVVNGGGRLDLNGNNVAAPLTLGLSGGSAMLSNLSGPATYSGDILFDADGIVSGTGLITISGSISGNPSGPSQPAYSLVKEGSNTLVLTGTNSYGTTQINAGTLQIGNAGVTGSLGTESVTNNGVLVFARLDTTTVSNVISGSGTVSIHSGTVSLAGNNTYSGQTTVQGGAALMVGTGGSAGSVGNIALDSGAFVRFNRSDEVQHAGTISGLGTLIKEGSNKLILTGINSYGETQILAGTLQIGAGGAVGSLGAASVSNAGELVFARADSIAVANAISGAGVVSISSGSVSLTGNNTYTGQTTVGNGATLLVGTGGANGSLAGDISLDSGATVRFNRSDTVFYGGNISGTGRFNMLGTGTLGLFGDSTLTSGSVSVDAGVLSIGTGGLTGSLAGDILNNAEVRFNRIGSLTYGEVISGSGSLSNVGSAAITLVASQTYYGATKVSAGSLTVQNSLENTSSIHVTGGTLSIVGFNSNADLTVTNAGRVDVSASNIILDGLVTNDTQPGGTLHFSSTSGVLTLSKGLFGDGTTSFASSATIGGTLSGGSIFVSQALTAGDIEGANVTAKDLVVSGTVSSGEVSVADLAQFNVVSGGSLRLSASSSIAALRGGNIQLQGGSAQLTIAGGQQAASGAISGAGGVVITGSLELAGDNSYTGGTQLDAGILTIANTSALRTGSLTIADGAALDVSQPAIILSNAVALGGSFRFLGTHALTLGGSVQLSGAASINVIDKTLVLAGSVNTSGNNTLVKLGGGALEFAGPSSDLTLTVSSGTVLARTDAFGSATTLEVAPSGSVVLLGNQTISSASISAQGAQGTLSLNSSSLTLSADSLFAGTLEGEAGSAVNIQSGVLTISGLNNRFLGVLNVSGGTLDLSGTTQNTGTVRLNGGEIRNGTLGSSGLTLSSGVVSGSLSGSAVLVKDSTPGTVSLEGDNRAFTGPVVIEGGILNIGAAKALTEAVAVSFNPVSGNATLALGADVSLRSLEGGGVVSGSLGIVDLAAGTLTLVSTGTATFGGSLKASTGVVLVVSGSGKQVLAGDSSQSEFQTVVKGGILEITNALALGSTVNALSLEGGTLALASNQPLAAPHAVEVKSDSTITLGGTISQSLGTLALQGTLSVGAAAPGAYAAAFGATVLNAAATLDAGSLTAVTLASLSGSYDLTKSGAGSLTLLGTNASTSGTRITGGSLLLGAQGSLASGSLTVIGVATLLDLGNTSQTVGGVSVTGATVKSGTLNGTAFTLSDAVIGASLTGNGSLISSGATILSARNGYAGPTLVHSGSLTIASSGSIHAGANLMVAAGATARFLGDEVTIGSISGLGTTLFSGTGSVSQNLTQGRLVFNGDAALASILGADVTVGGFATVSSLGSGSLTLSGSGGIIHTVSGGSLHLAAAGQTVSVGTLTAGDVLLAGTLSAGGGTFAGNLAGSGTLALISGGSMSLGGTISQFSGTYAVDGTFNLTAAASDTAALAVGAAGKVTLSLDGGSLGAVRNDGAISLAVGTFSMGSLSGSGTIRSDSSATLKVGQSGGTGATYGGSLTGAISLIKQGSGALRLSGLNDFTGNTQIEGGSLIITSGQALSAGSIRVVDRALLFLDGQLNSLDIANAVSVAGSGTLLSAGAHNRISGPLTISDAAHIVVSSGTLSTGSITGAASLTLTGNIDVAGAVTLGNGGTLRSLAGNLALGEAVQADTFQVAGGSVVLGGSLTGLLDLSGSGAVSLGGSISVGGLKSSPLGGLHLSAHTLTILNGAGLTADGTISGTGVLVLNSGSLTLGGNNTYTGGTTIEGGKLTVTGRIADGTALTISGGSAHFLNTASLATVSNAGELRFGSLATIGILTGAGVTAFSAGAQLGAVTAGQLDISGPALLGPVTGGSLVLRSGSIQLQSIDGPASVTVLGNEVTVATLTGGLLINSGTLNAGGGTFTGQIQGNGVLNATGALTLASSAQLDTALSYAVAGGGLLTFTDARQITTVRNQGTVVFNGGTLQSHSGTGTLTVETGSLAVGTGTGRLEVRSGASASYSGAVTLESLTNAGSLRLAADSVIRDFVSTGTLVHAGGLTITGSGTLRALASPSNTSLIKSGSGRLTLGSSVADAYSGTTFVSGGTLTLASGPTLAGDVTVNGGSLELAAPNQLGGQLHLASGFIDLAGNDQVIVGSFKATGGVLGKPGETASLTADVLDITGGTINAVVLPSFTTTRYFSGTLTIGQIGTAGRSNPLEVGGTGAFVTANTVYTTDLAIVGSNNTLSITGGSSSALINAGTITIGGTNNVVEFTQGFAPSGPLLLTVGDASSTGGSLKVADPGLVLGGSQTLMGSGTVDGNVQLASGAILAPGNSPGRLKITGALTIGAGVATVLEYTAEKSVAVGTGAADKLEVGTIQALGGNVSAFAVSGTFSGGSFNATRVSRVNQVGTKSLPVVVYGTGPAPASLPAVTSWITVGGPLAGGTYRSLVVTANLSAVQNQNPLQGGTVYLNITRNPFASFATSGNAAATGQILDRDASLTSSNAAISNLIDLLDIQPTAAGIASTLAALDPGIYADLGNIGLDRLRDIQSGLANHLDMLALDNVGEASLSLAVKPGQSTVAAALEQSRAWTTAYGGWGSRSSDPNSGTSGYNANHFGDISGVETKLGSLTLGLFGAAGLANTTFGNGRGKVDSDSWHTGFYGNFAAGPLVWDASVAYGQSQNKLSRSVNVPGGGSTTGRSLGSEWTGQIGLAVPFRSESGSLMLTPSLHLLHANVSQAGLQESSLNGLEAVVRKNNTGSTSLRTGLQAAKSTRLAEKQTRLTASLDWIQSLDSNSSNADIALAGPGAAPSRFQGSKTGASAVRVGLGAEVATTERTRLRLNVDQQRRSGVNSTFGSVSFSLHF